MAGKPFLLALPLLLSGAPPGHAGPTAAQTAASPFVPGDAASLGARVVDLEAASKKAEVGVLVEIEVSNPTGLHAEPLVFRFTPRGKDPEPYEVRRVEAPHFGRAGPMVAPRGKATYPLLVPKAPKELKGVSVEVLSASFAEELPDLPREPASIATVGRPSSENRFDDERGRSLDRSFLPLENRLDHPVDLVLRAEFSEPFRATSLVTARLEPGESVQHVVRDLPLGRLAGAGEVSYLGAKITKLELVDWSALVDDGTARATQILRQAWEGWRRVPEERFPLSARFSIDVDGPAGSSSARGTLRFLADNSVRVEAEGAAGAVSDAKELAEDLSWSLTRPPLDALLEGNELQLQALGATSILRLRHAPFLRMQGATHLGLRDGRIVFDASGPLGGGLRNSWLGRGEGDDGTGWRLLGRDVLLSTLDDLPDRELRIDWSAGPVALPAVVRVRDQGILGREVVRTTLTLGDWRSGVELGAEPVVPAGPLAERLREAWDGFYRYPDPDVVLEGAFQATNAGNDDLWGGVRKVKGSFALRRFQGAFWRDTAFELDGRWDDLEAARLVSAVRDRFLMWSVRDLHREPRFATAFAGVELVEEAGGWIGVRGGPVEGVRVVDGRVVALRRFGGEVELRWRKIADVLVVAERTVGRESVEVEYARVGAKARGDDRGGAPWLLPTAVTFRDVFTGRDRRWGPESLKLSRWSIHENE